MFVDLIRLRSTHRYHQSVIALLNLREILQNHAFCDVTKLRNAELNGTESNGINRIFANMENCGNRFGARLYGPSPLSADIYAQNIYAPPIERMGFSVPGLLCSRGEKSFFEKPLFFKQKLFFNKKRFFQQKNVFL